MALAIAICKASLVVLFFMHVWYSTRLTKMIVAASIFWLILLLFITMADSGRAAGWAFPAGKIRSASKTREGDSGKGEIRRSPRRVFP